MNKKIISLFYLIILLHYSLNSNEIDPPKNLQKIKKICYPTFKISTIDKPFITYDNIFFIANNVLNAFNYNYLGFLNRPNIFYPYGDNSFIKPLNQYSTPPNFYSSFFTKDCYLRVYNENGKNTFNHLEFQRYFQKLNKNGCYDSLRIYYDNPTRFMAVYNINSNKIIVFNYLQDFWKHNDNTILEVEMKGNIKHAFIFSKGNINDEKSVLIGIDSLGNVNFWNLKNYCNFFESAFNALFYNNLIKSFENKYFYTQSNQDIATFIQGNKLLYINNDNFHLYDIDKIEKIKSQNNLIPKVSSVLGLKDGNALVGTINGYLYLIAFKSGSIIILDKIKLCQNRIYSLSSIENCASGTRSCYKIAANCGILKIFEIQN